MDPIYRYRVTVRRTVEYTRSVFAHSADEAREKVADMLGVEDNGHENETDRPESLRKLRKGGEAWVLSTDPSPDSLEEWTREQEREREEEAG